MKRTYFALFCLLLTLNMPAQYITIHMSDHTTQSISLSEITNIAFDPDEKIYSTPRELQANLSVTLHTDSACYHPGAQVQFRTSSAIPEGAKCRYMHLDKVLDEVDITSGTWTWKVPDQDFQGYMAQLYLPGKEFDTVLGTIAVDVSSDWRKFPRYGFVATFGPEKTPEVVKSEMEWLNRCHINGVQFQDWHYKHHWPWGGSAESGEIATYKDIANRTIHTQSIKDYIDAQHNYGMKSIFYNLCYGALEDAQSDGVSKMWYIFQDKNRKTNDKHDLPSSWKSDIYLLNPQNVAWQNYLAERNKEVYDHLDFDGFQIDQLGYRGPRYTYTGASIDMPKAYASFIKAMKQANPNKRLIMNAVSNYGTEQIAGTGAVDFLYNELWQGEGEFANLLTTIQENERFGGDSLKTVFAAYMNYNMDNTSFNTPGVLLTDAIMFALGGSHLELGGDHMLCREYFPYAGLSISTTLKSRLMRYYDFLTAYENLLRDGGTLDTSCKLVPSDVSGKYKINAWSPVLGQITSIARKKEDCTVLHLINFTHANSLSWRDADGKMPSPNTISKLQLKLTNQATPVQHVYVASPDALAGSMTEVEFLYDKAEGTLTFTLPSLTYWSMVVIK